MEHVNYARDQIYNRRTAVKRWRRVVVFGGIVGRSPIPTKAYLPRREMPAAPSHFANDVVTVAVELLAFPLDLAQANCDNS